LAEDFVGEWQRFFENAGNTLGDPWDWNSFVWGIAAGGVITLVVEGLTLYFTWPIWLELIETLVGGTAIREIL